MNSKEEIPVRYHIQYNASVARLGAANNAQGQISIQRMPQRIVPLTKNQKFTQCMEVSKEICETLSVCGAREYSARKKLLDDLVLVRKLNKVVFIMTSEEEDM